MSHLSLQIILPDRDFWRSALLKSQLLSFLTPKAACSLRAVPRDKAQAPSRSAEHPKQRQQTAGFSARPGPCHRKESPAGKHQQISQGAARGEEPFSDVCTPPPQDDYKCIKHLMIQEGTSKGLLNQALGAYCTDISFMHNISSHLPKRQGADTSLHSKESRWTHRNTCGQVMSPSCPPWPKFNYFFFYYQIINSTKPTTS